MRIKLDENLGRRCIQELQTAGHDVVTVRDQGMAGASDSAVIGRCRDEQRVLLTLDLDFANPLVFDPRLHAGIAVLRLPRKLEPVDLYDAVATLIGALRTRSIAQKLWIVERARIREYQPEGDEIDPTEQATAPQ
jgi:hypothetical protein